MLNDELAVGVDGVTDAGVVNSGGDIDGSPIGGDVEGEFVFVSAVGVGADGVADCLELVEGDEVGDDGELDEL
ncbi:hypothetical protein ACLOJK_039835 [Asimina triloba]